MHADYIPFPGVNFSKMQLYAHELSGNCYKVVLLLSLLGLEHEIIRVDLIVGEQKSAEFLKLNPFGQVPVLIDGEVVLRDSQAILVYLARQYGGESWLPSQPEAMGKVLQWLSTAANEIQNSLSAARRFFLLGTPVDLEGAQQKARYTLEVIDKHLLNRDWLETNHPTIADVACYPYIELASDAQIALEAYPQVSAWVTRIKQLPLYVMMPGF